MIELKQGMILHAIIPFTAPQVAKIYIEYVLQSYYDNRKLIVYRVYGKHKQWWHEFMCKDTEMESYIKLNNQRHE